MKTFFLALFVFFVGCSSQGEPCSCDWETGQPMGDISDTDREMLNIILERGSL